MSNPKKPKKKRAKSLLKPTIRAQSTPKRIQDAVRNDESIIVSESDIKKAERQLVAYRARTKARDRERANKARNAKLEKDESLRKELVRRELARRHLVRFIQATETGYKAGWAHHLICRKLEEFLEKLKAGEGPRLMLALPPRFGKSKIASEKFPAWALGQYPDLEIISSSYGVSLPVGFSRKVRATLEDPYYQQIFPGTSVDPENRNVEGWMTNAGGGFIPAGVGGGITGKGADLGIVDDPFKDAEEADSTTMRDKVWDWWSSTFYTRLSPTSGVIVINCMVGNTRVTMADGTYKELKDIRPGDKVWAWKEGKAVVRKVLNWTECGEDNVYEIKTGSSTVRANARHPFLFKSAKGHYSWVRVEDIPKLGKNQTMVHMGEINPQEHQKLNEDEAWLLGYMFGDGWITKRDGKNYDKKRNTFYPRKGYVTCVATTHREEENKKVLRLFRKLFGVQPKLTEYGYIRTEVQRVGKWFTEHGLVGKAKTKRLPAYLFEQPLHIRKAFINGHNTADGSKAVNGRCTFGIANNLLAHDIRHLARGCGYKVTNLSRRTYVAQPPNSPEPVTSEHNHVSWSKDTADFYYRRARSIKPVGKEVVYDIQVEDAECFIADGLVSHNTRWHDDDLSGRLIQQMKSGLIEVEEYREHLTAQGDIEEDQIDKMVKALEMEIDHWEVLSFPAIAEGNEYLSDDDKIIYEPGPIGNKHQLLRAEGDALHPERYPIERLKKIKRSLQPRHWSALYQQNPVPEEGMYFTKDMFRFIPVSPDWRELPIFMAWDLAIGKKEINDYTVGVAGCIDYEDRVHVLNIVRARMNAFQIVEAILDMYKMYSTSTSSAMVGIEQGQIKLAIGPQLEKRMQERKLYPAFDEELKPMTDKLARARPLQGRMQQGMVLLPSNQPWVETLQNEFLRFPGGVHDDIVDACAWLLRMTARQPTPKPPKHMQLRSWKDKLKNIQNQRTGSPMSA